MLLNLCVDFVSPKVHPEVIAIVLSCSLYKVQGWIVPWDLAVKMQGILNETLVMCDQGYHLCGHDSTNKHCMCATGCGGSQTLFLRTALID